MAIVTDAGGGEFRPRRTEAVKVLGVDILRDRTIRDYAPRRGPDQPPAAERAPSPACSSQAFLELLTSPQSVVITEKLARRRGYALGSRDPADGRRSREHLRRPGAAAKTPGRPG